MRLGCQHDDSPSEAAFLFKAQRVHSLSTGDMPKLEVRKNLVPPSPSFPFVSVSSGAAEKAPGL